MFLDNKIDIFNNRAAKFYYILFNLIAIAIIIYIGVDAFYRIILMKYSYGDIKTVDTIEAVVEPTSVNPRLNDYKVIVDRNIFSKNSVPAQKGDINIDSLNLTSLKLVLLGTIAGSDNKTSAAFIQDTAARTEDLYREGDSIQGATVKSILRKKVILRIGNRDEVLTMEATESGANAKTSDADQASAAVATISTDATAVERNITIPRATINESLKDLNELLSQASIQPHATEGEPDGLTITGIKAGSIYRRMGLRNGDIIRAINNEAIKSAEDLINMYNDLKSAPDISLQVTRRGQERSFNYSFTD